MATAATHRSTTVQRTSQPPSALLAMTELPRALVELGALPLAAPLLASAPRGDGHPVLVLPGFVTSDASTAVMRAYLNRLGYDAHAWELGRNLGPRAIGREGEKLIARLKAIHEATGQRVSLIGWSLGGIMARLLASRLPDAVRQVVTLGSPFAGDPRATNVWKLYEYLSGQRVDGDHAKRQMAEVSSAAPVPSTAIYSRGDGVVAWQNCVEESCDHAESIEVHGSHCGLAVNASVLFAVADRLAQPDGDWHPFQRTGLRWLLYPAAGRA
ncbi:pimeloyl-ACP methyl ester carboxylesterase [Sphingomonas jinjuensis]|uniref:Pimeloyl-ACP methyl ester carboxylesterase n=1 Tax=Sphingomonas jinjuensis TaxID=535907 RepID=A0A840FAG8_9SPHN|nr:alpha/beta fold hydrolase [Sphingomonas jinjuensis]MBB4153276.1 pimeloyl-ACP methyl ester carboxylesterase [Sphingomonas jinjuensis]